MRLFTFILCAVLSGYFTSASAQIYDPVKWTFDQQQIDGETFDLIFTAKIDEGWSIYSQYLESEDGPVKTSFNYDAGDHYELVGKNEEKSKYRKAGYDKLFDMNVIKFTKSVQFVQRVKVIDGAKKLTGYVNFMTCDATKCLPPADVDFAFSLVAKTTGGTGSVTPTPAPPAAKSTPEAPAKTPTKTAEVAKPTEAPAKQPATTPEASNPETPATAATTDMAVTGTGFTESGTPNGDRNSGILDPVKWSIKATKLEDGTFELTLRATAADEWYLYSQKLDGEDGPIPTSFAFNTEGGQVELLGETSESGPVRIKEYDKNFEMDLIKFKKEAIFTQRLKVADPSQPVVGDLEFMTCTNGMCLPPALRFFTFSPETLKAFVGEEDQRDAFFAGGGVVPLVEEGVIDQARPVLQATYVEPLGNCGEEEKASGSLLWIFLMGFAGGFFALLTPCVFPMIPLTVSFFTKSSKTRWEGIRNGLTYGISIIVIYVSIGLLITGIFGPDALNLLSTHWLPNVLFFLIFLAFAFSFFGYYEITLPSSWTNSSDRMADKGGLIGTFFMAFTLALVSFSCTGPIIGTALVQSATNAMGPFVVMLGFSSALALPFGLFAAFPAVLNSLPKSGSWMNSVKVVLGFLELALALKFLSVADMTMHWGILGYELFLGLWILVFAGMSLYLFGFIRFPHDSPSKKLSPTRLGFALLALGLTLYLGTGFRYNSKTQSYDSLALMSGLAPPAQYNYFLTKSKADQDIKSRYPSFTKCANNLDCFKDYYEGMAYARENQQPVLLDFTGHGCVNCRKTEEHIWIKDKVWYHIYQDFVLISLYVDDRKSLDETIVSLNSNKRLRSVGNMWADFQIVNFQQNSQPLYVMVTPDEKVLAKPRGYREGADDYAKFLECGLETFEKISSQGESIKPLGELTE